MDTTDPEKIGPKPAEFDGTTMLQLLNDCSGVFQPGILTALVGSSGAGKTTLMDVLAGRKTGTRSFFSNRLKRGVLNISLTKVGLLLMLRLAERAVLQVMNHLFFKLDLSAVALSKSLGK